MHFTQRKSRLDCDDRLFTKSGLLRHYVRTVTNDRAVYTNLRVQETFEQCQDHTKCVLAHVECVAMTGGAKS